MAFFAFLSALKLLQDRVAVNYGDVEIKELCLALQSVFQVQVDDPYRIFIDLVNRKITPVKFIPKMEEGFLRKIYEVDKLK